jgi:hypothetical protein
VDDIGMKAILVSVLVVAVFLLFLYQTRIRASERDIGTLVKFTSTLLLAAVPAWILFPAAITRYIVACISIVLLARTAYIWAKRPKRNR